MRPALLALALSLLAACHHHRGGDGGDPGEVVFREQERNDDPLTANSFGVLRPGDRFFIDGFVRDDLVDPFDGFAFTADGPLHVDFQLFIGNAAADLDVCLYDPQLDETLACFATENDPEQGGVDVFAGGLDFHLVVESFRGDATYSLEIVVLPLFAATAQDGLTSRAATSAASGQIRGVAARAERVLRAEHAYRLESPHARPVLHIEQHFLSDEKHGTALMIVRIQR